MRRRIFSLIATAALLTCLLWACCGNEPDEQGTTIEGTWNWVQTCGGIGGWQYCRDSFTAKYSLKIDKSRYYMYKDKKVLFSGRYSLKMGPSRPFGDSSLIITTKDEYVDTLYIKSIKNIPNIVFGNGNYIRFNDTVLSTTQPCVDCFASSFRRK